MSNKKAGNKKRRCIRALIAIIFAAVALFAGYKAVSILTEYKEGADTYKDMERYMGNETIYLREIKRVCGGVKMGKPLEVLLEDFSKKQGE